MNQSATFASIVHWYDPSSLQSFIVNSRILQAFARTLEDNATVTYVLLDTFPTLVSMQAAWNTLASQISMPSTS